MHSLKTLRYLIVVFCVLFLTSCNDSSASLPTIEINENNVDTISFDETIRINNCGNATNSEQTKERSFSTSIEGAIELGVNYQIVEGNISAKYGQHRSATTSQKLIAAPNTNMEFVLRWSEEVRAGNVTVNGKTSTYTVRIPVSVEQISSRDLGCSGNSVPPKNPTQPPLQSIPTPENTQKPDRVCPMIVIEGTIGGLPIVQTGTWSELGITTQEPQSANLGDVCSRTNDNEVKVWIGYWSANPNYLDFRGEMTPDAAISLVTQNPGQPVIIVPWGE